MTCASDTTDDAVITLTQGSDEILEIVATVDGLSADITAAELYFTVKERWKDVTPALLKRNLAAGGDDSQILITVPQTGSNKGKAQIFIDASDTAALDVEKTYVCDCWMKLGGKRKVIISMRDFVLMPRVSVVA